MLKDEPQTHNLIEVKMCNTSVVILKGTAFLFLNMQTQVFSLYAPGQRGIASHDCYHVCVPVLNSNYQGQENGSSAFAAVSLASVREARLRHLTCTVIRHAAGIVLLRLFCSKLMCVSVFSPD